jgi:hypothetical protein
MHTSTYTSYIWSLNTTFISVFSTYPILLHVSAAYDYHQVYIFLLKLFHCTSNCISQEYAELGAKRHAKVEVVYLFCRMA